MPTQKYYNNTGKVVPSVTTVIGNLGWNREALMRWVYSSMKQGVDPYEKRDKACDLGTYIHLCIEHHIYNAPVPEEDTSRMSFEDVLIAEKAVDKYKQLESDLALTCLESEIALVSEEYNFGGCPDNIYQCDTRRIKCTVENEVVAAYLCGLGMEKPVLLNDTKSSKGVWASNIIQLGAYDHLIRESTKYRPDGYLIVKVNKDIDQVIDDINLVSLIPVPKKMIETGWEIFKHLLYLHTIKPSFEKDVKQLTERVSEKV
jgi:hypothetical protein